MHARSCRKGNNTNCNLKVLLNGSRQLIVWGHSEFRVTQKCRGRPIWHAAASNRVCVLTLDLGPFLIRGYCHWNIRRPMFPFTTFPVDTWSRRVIGERDESWTPATYAWFLLPYRHPRALLGIGCRSNCAHTTYLVFTEPLTPMLLCDLLHMHSINNCTLCFSFLRVGQNSKLCGDCNMQVHMSPARIWAVLKRPPHTKDNGPRNNN